MDALARPLVVYNDEFSGGQDVTIRWNAGSHDPQGGATESLASGSFTIPVPYGEKREQLVKFDLPDKITTGRWLHLTLTASKAGKERFTETYRLGALGEPPAPVIAYEPSAINLGRSDSADQWHTVRLVNRGGGASVPWKIQQPAGIRFKLSEGNLRGEQDLHFQIDPTKLETDAREWEVTVSPTTGNETKLRVRINR
jgi:hypothetical protein